MERIGIHQNVAIGTSDLGRPIEREKQQVGPTHLLPDVAFVLFSRYRTIHSEHQVKRRCNTTRTPLAILAGRFSRLVAVKAFGPNRGQLLCQMELDFNIASALMPG